MKNSEILQLTDNELNDTVQDLKIEYTRLNMTHAVSPLENPLKIRKMRRTIARLNTEKQKRMSSKKLLLDGKT